MILKSEDLKQLDRIKRLNIINSITGVKPANLIGTKGPNEVTNLAIFSSVVHLGSNPALLGFVTRPSAEVPRHTLENIETMGHYTINHVPADMVQQAHQTAAKYPREQSEFKACGFGESYVADFPAPFVAEAQIKIGMRLLQKIPIDINQTQLVIGEVELLEIDESMLSEEGHINLTHAGSAGISGLNSYYQLKLIDTFPYART